MWVCGPYRRHGNKTTLKCRWPSHSEFPFYGFSSGITLDHSPPDANGLLGSNRKGCKSVLSKVKHFLLSYCVSSLRTGIISFNTIFTNFISPAWIFNTFMLALCQ